MEEEQHHKHDDQHHHHPISAEPLKLLDLWKFFFKSLIGLAIGIGLAWLFWGVIP